MTVFFLEKSDKETKRFVATFKNGEGIKRVYFGSPSGSTFIDNFDRQKKENYIKRHSKLNENWLDPYTPGALSRWLLWEDANLFVAIQNYKKKFNFE